MKDEMGTDGLNRFRLQRLASFLAYAPDPVGFDMRKYVSKHLRGDSQGRQIHVCGSVGCAVGQATLLWPKPLGRGFYEWSQEILVIDMKNGVNAWGWCFAPDWADADNTRLGAAKRIQFLLDNDGELPEWDYYDEKTVAMYQDIVVKRESSGVIADMMDKIRRENRTLRDVKRDDQPTVEKRTRNLFPTPNLPTLPWVTGPNTPEKGWETVPPIREWAREVVNKR